MPESRGGVEGRAAARWGALGRVLPKDVRERIYEPAFADLLYRRLTRGARGRLPFAVYAIGTALRCVPIALPRLVVRDGAMTRFARVTVFVMAAVGILIAVLMALTTTEPGY